METNIILSVYEIIGELTPLAGDCGALCGAACCQPDADGQGGIRLFPGEAALLKDRDWVKTLEPILICDGHCERTARPLGCRIFPLSPARGRDGRWSVRLEARARAMCPLISSGLQGLNPDFVRAVRRALRHVAETEEGEAFLESWNAEEEAFRKPLW